MDNWSIYYRIGSFSVPKNRKKRGDAILQGGSLTIYDTEEAYVEALSDYLNKNMELGVVTVAFSNLDKFIEYLEKNQTSYVFVCEDFDKHILKGKIDTFHIGFVIGPRINAGGRIESPYDSLRIFLSE